MIPATPSTAGSSARRRLAVIRWVSCVDALLLAALVGCSLWGYRAGVKVLGPLHGVNFVLLVGLAADGAWHRWWGWWFPAVVALLLGPLGAIPGEYWVRRGLAAGDA